MDEFNCPLCKYPCVRDEVDIGVGTQYGPWDCIGCGWSQDDELADIISTTCRGDLCTAGDDGMCAVHPTCSFVTARELLKRQCDAQVERPA